MRLGGGGVVGRLVQNYVVPPPTFTSAWQTFSLGEGGNVQGIHIYPDGTITCHVDTYGGYLYIPSGSGVGANGTIYQAPCWQQLVTINSLPASAISPSLIGSGNIGAGEIVAAPSNTNVLYMLFTGKVYVSTNKGTTWVLTPQTSNLVTNGGAIQNWIAVDPNNPDIVYVTSPSQGAFYTINGRAGGSSVWHTVPGIANATGGNVGGGSIAFDSSSSVVGGVTQRLLISIVGTGVYETTNGGPPSGGSFSLTSGGPTTLEQLECDKFSQAWGTTGFIGNDGIIWRYTSGSWSSHNTGVGGVALCGLTFDPNTGGVQANNRIVTSKATGELIISLDNGSTWTSNGSTLSSTSTAPQPVWLGVANQSGINLNRLVYDSTGVLWAAAGLGVWNTPNPIVSGSLSGTTVYSTNTIGIEQLVTNQIISPPGNSPLAAVWDKGIFLVKNPDIYPSIQWTNATSNAYGTVGPIVGGWSADYASAAGTKNFIVVWAVNNAGPGTAPASSSDGGNTWTLFSSTPAAIFYGGSVAASTSTNWLMVPGQNEVLSFTSNAGVGWTPSTATGNHGWVSNYVNNRQPIAADRVTSGKFYAVDLGTGSPGSHIFWCSTDGGNTFTNLGTPFTGELDTFNGKLLSVPGKADNIFFSAGYQSSFSVGNLWKSTNAGTNWSIPNSNLTDIGVFGFGAPKPGGGGYPMIYAIGFLNTVWGIFASADAGANWAAINVPANQQVWAGNSVDEPMWITGDANVYGRIYVGFIGSGGTYIDTADACPWVNFSNVNPNAALTGPVTLTAQHSGLVPVTSVQFSVDGVNIGSALTGVGPYSVSWNTGGVATGAHTLTVTAIGSNGSGSFSIPITTS